jgi:hypothetical protein
MSQPALVVTLSCVATFATADVVVKDHLTDSSVWSTAGLVSNFEDTSSSADRYVACAFTGNGAAIKQVEGIYWIADGSGTADAGDWRLMDFEVVFSADAAALQADPRAGSFHTTLLQPDNVDWLTPVASIFEPSSMQMFSAYHFVFDLESQGLVTTSGQEHFISVTPSGGLFTAGQSGVAHSDGGAGAIGIELDWIADFFTFPTVIDTLQSAGGLTDHVAHRVVLGDAPCPVDADGNGLVGIGDFLLVLAEWGPCAGPCAPDVDDDGVVGVLDFLLVLSAWGACP